MLLLARQREGVSFLSQKMPSNWIRSIRTAHNCKFFLDSTSSNTAHCAVKAIWGNFWCPWSSLASIRSRTDTTKAHIFCKVKVYWGSAVKSSYLCQVFPHWNGLHRSWTYNGIMIKCLPDLNNGEMYYPEPPPPIVESRHAEKGGELLPTHKTALIQVQIYKHLFTNRW